jgi:hypothetical protein
MNRYILLLLVIIGLSCERIQLPDPVINDPLFELSLNIGESEFSLGGQGTEVNTDFTWDNLGVRVFNSSIRNKNSGEELSIIFRDDRLSKRDISGDTFSLFRQDTFFFANLQSRAKNVRMLLNRMIDPAFASWARWESSVNSNKGLNFNFLHPSGIANETICLYIKDETINCRTTYCKDKVGNTARDFPLEGFVIEGNQIRPQIGAGFIDPYTIRWDDLYQESLAIKQSGLHNLFIIVNNGQKIYNVELYLELDAQNRIKTPCFSGFFTDLFTFSEDPMFNTVEVNWKDNQGKSYSSARNVQNSQANFIIDKVTRLDVINPDGFPVQKLDVKFSCRLFAADGSSIVIKDAQGTIGFAYD